MIYYKQDNQLREMDEAAANRKITIKKIGEVITTSQDYEGNDLELSQAGVVTDEVRYITTITDIFTAEAKPTITAKQKMDLVKNEEGQVEWQVSDLSEGEIAELKEATIKIMDEKTQQKIFEGFDYDGEKFSMSLSAQANWLFLFNKFMSGTFPDEGWAIATKDDAEYLLTKDKAEGFFTASSTYKEQVLAEGREKKREFLKTLI